MKQFDLLIFSSRELQRSTGMKPNAVRLWLIRRIKEGKVVPLKKRRGLYRFAQHLPHPWLIANRLYQPSYISLESALAYYGVLPETVYTVTSVTTKTTRSFEAEGRRYLYRKIKKEAFGGCRIVLMEGQPVLIAEPEKAMADYLYLTQWKGEKVNERLRWKVLNRQKLRRYLQQFHRPALTQWSDNVIRSNP